MSELRPNNLKAAAEAIQDQIRPAVPHSARMRVMDHALKRRTEAYSGWLAEAADALDAAERVLRRVAALTVEGEDRESYRNRFSLLAELSDEADAALAKIRGGRDE